MLHLNISHYTLDSKQVFFFLLQKTFKVCTQHCQLAYAISLFCKVIGFGARVLFLCQRKSVEIQRVFHAFWVIQVKGIHKPE